MTATVLLSDPRSMRVGRGLFALGLIALIFGSARSVRADEFWLEPSTPRATAGQEVSLKARLGSGFRGIAKVYEPKRTVRFMARAAADIDLRPQAVDGDTTFGRLMVPDEGGVMIAHETTFFPLGHAAEDFDRFLEREGLEAARAERSAKPNPDPVRERYARTAKTWISGAQSDARRVFGSTMLAMELVPLSDPSLPGTLHLRLLYRNSPLVGAPVRAWRRPEGGTQAPDTAGAAVETRSGPGGIVTLDLEGAGDWLVSAIQTVRCPRPNAADWETHRTTLTFSRPEADAAERGSP